MTGRTYCPRCDYWKLSYYDKWAPHKENVLKLRDELKQLFPEISIKVGYGASSEEWEQILPQEKDELDLELWMRYKVVGHVEVSGSPGFYLSPEEPIWIRPGKFNTALSKEIRGEECWFYMVYKNNIFSLRTIDILPYQDNVFIETPKGKPEKYIHVPQDRAFPKEKLFEWIRNKIERLKREKDG